MILKPIALNPNTRRNLFLGVLALTVVAAIFAPDQYVDKFADKSIAPINQNSKSAMISSSNPPHGSTIVVPDTTASMLPDKRAALNGTPKDIFEIKQPPMSAAEKLRLAQQSPAPAPVAPPLPFVYMGKILDHGQLSVFLSREEKPYIAKTGDVLDGTYRVDSIRPPLMELTYLPLSQKQSLNIGEEK